MIDKQEEAHEDGEVIDFFNWVKSARLANQYTCKKCGYIDTVYLSERD